MKVKKLEKRIIEITRDESFELKSREYYEPLANIYEKYLVKVARLNDAEYQTDILDKKYYEEYLSTSDSTYHQMICDNLKYTIEKERKQTKLITIELLNELFINQELYNILEDDMPHLEEIACYLYKNRKAKRIIKDIIRYLSEWLDEISEDEFDEIYVFSLIDYKLGLYYEYNILPLLEKACKMK